MSGTGLALFNTAMPAVPAEVNKFFEDNTNMTGRQTVPSLSYEGKSWSIVLDGEKTLLTKTDKETGEREPVMMFRAVILDYAKRRGRAYYEGAYDPNKISLPKCWSDDGYVPNADVKEKQSDKCETCPWAMKGSKTTDQNKAVTACSQHRMIALVPAHDLSFQPLRLKIAITSDWDGQSPDHEAAGWFGFNNYTDMLRSKQVPHTAKLVTKIKFDPKTAYPKLLFSPDRWLTPDELVTVIPVVQSAEVKSLIDGTWGANGSDATRRDAAPAGAAAATADDEAPAVTQVAGPTAEEIAAQKAADDKAAKKAARQAAAQKAADEAARLAAEAAAAAAADDDEEDEEISLPGTPATATTAAPAKPAATAATAAAAKPATPPGGAKAAQKPAAAPATTTAAPGDISDLLKDWGGSE